LCLVPIRANHETAAHLIRQQGHTVTSVAEHLGIERTNLTHMLAGRRQFPADKIPALAELLKVSPYELLGPEDPRAAVVELARLYDVTRDELEGAVA
jgi:DNA-binding transcriptional regulator YdaS (Cro superfamily)